MSFYLPESYRDKAERYGFKGRFLAKLVMGQLDRLESTMDEEQLRVYALAIKVGLLLPSKIVPRPTADSTA